MIRTRSSVIAWLLALIATAALSSAAPATPPLRVMTFNIRLPIAQDGPNAWEHRRDLAARMIGSERPDVIGTQELFKSQGDFLLERLPGYAWFGMDRRGGHADEHVGIFYRRDRLRVIELGNFALSDTPAIPGSISWDHPYPRMVTWGLFETSEGKSLYVVNTHFPYREEDSRARQKAARQISDWIEALPSDVPVALIGDFNANPDTAEHALLTEEFEDAWLSAAAREGPANTFHAFTGTADRRIDWILLRGLEAKRVHTVTANEQGRYPSDHFPVVADLTWPAESEKPATERSLD